MTALLPSRRETDTFFELSITPVLLTMCTMGYWSAGEYVMMSAFRSLWRVGDWPPPHRSSVGDTERGHG